MVVSKTKKTPRAHKLASTRPGLWFAMVLGPDGVEESDWEGKTWADLGYVPEPLTHIAVLKGDEEGLAELTKLLDEGADVNEVDDVGRTILWKACKHGEHTMTKLLIERGADRHLASTNLGWFPMLTACGHSWRHLECMKMLIEQDTDDINREDLKGWTPMLHAAMSHNEALCKLLVKHGARADKTIVQGLIDTPHTPAMLAKLCKDDHIAAFLEKSAKEQIAADAAGAPTPAAGA